MRWLHYTSNKIEEIKTDFKQNWYKPKGIWGSYNDEWINWCNENGFATFDTSNYYLYEIKIKPEAKILIIDSLKRYLEVLGYGDKLDWNKVSKDYDGVIFLNYQEIKKDMYKSNLFDTLICTLDISCCCIWNLFSAANLEFVENVIENYENN